MEILKRQLADDVEKKNKNARITHSQTYKKICVNNKIFFLKIPSVKRDTL